MSVVFRIQGLNFYLSSPRKPSVGQSSPPKQQESVDTWTEIERRNQNVLHPLKSKDTSESHSDFPIYHRPLTDISNKPFYINSYHSYRPLRQSLQRKDEQIPMNPSIYLNKYINKQSSVVPVNNDPSFLFGNSIVKSNKAYVLNVFDQQLLDGDNTNSYVDKYGITIDEHGPFWPEHYRILHPTPKLLSRESTPKEFYLSPSMLSKKRKKT